jgi:hypothetical protein
MRLLGIALTVLTSLTATSASSVELLPHRAAYRLSLVSAERASGVADVQGGLVMEMRSSCGGWISNQRLGFVAATEEGEGFSYDVRFSSWESADTTELSFNVRSYDDGELSEEFRGRARLEAPGGRGVVDFVLPGEDHIELPAGTLFPTEHVRSLIEAARQDKRFVSHDVFDGSGAQGLNRITAVIGPARDLPAGAGTERRWRVNLAYYAVEADDASPQFEIGFDLSETGVFYDVMLNYGDFTLRGELEDLERLTANGCE